MTIELFGIARARAGCARVELEARNLGEALVRLAERCPGLVPEVLHDGRLTARYVAATNGGAFLRDPATPLAAGDTVLVLGSQAGG